MTRRPSADQKGEEHADITEDEEYYLIRMLTAQDSILAFSDDDAGTLPDTMARKSYFTVIIYDIVDNSRRRDVAKLLLGYGDRVQYSGFEGHLTRKQIERMTEKIRNMIDHERDRVRIYKISGIPQLTVFGKIGLTEDESFTVV